MTKKERYTFVINWFEANLPTPQTELHYSNAYQLTVAVILSAQCTDKRVNQITPALFKAYPTAQALSQSNIADIYKHIKSCSYPNNKAKNLLGMAQKLTNEFGGELPTDAATLQKLPGVGRKTANVLASVLYSEPVMPVDTHVFRVARRIGLATLSSKTPRQVEDQLTAALPPDKIHNAHHWLILHGRYTCKARKPACQQCGIAQACNFFKKNSTL